MDSLEDMVKMFSNGDMHGAQILARGNMEKNQGLCHTVLGVAYFSQNKYELAGVEIEKAVALGAKDTAILYSVLGRVEQHLAKKAWKKKNHLKKAEYYYEKSLRLEPKAITLKLLIGTCTEYSKRAGYGEMYLEMYGPDQHVHELMLDAYHVMGETNNARKVFRLAKCLR